MWQSWMRWKMPLCKWHTFWMAPCLICYFIVKLFYIERKWLLMKNLATILPLKSKLPGKFYRFNALSGSTKMLKNAWVNENQWKWNIENHFMGPKQRASLRKLFSLPPTPNPPPSDKILLRPWEKKLWSYTEIYRHLLSKCFKNTVLWRLEMVQPECFFWHQTETCLLENL